MVVEIDPDGETTLLGDEYFIAIFVVLFEATDSGSSARNVDFICPILSIQLTSSFTDY